MADKIHCIRKTLRLTPKEAQLLAEKSNKAGLAEAAYLRFLISQRPNDHPQIRQLIRELKSEINHIGVNINQIVHHHNYELYSQTDREQLIAYMRKLNNSVKKVEEQIGNQ